MNGAFVLRAGLTSHQELSSRDEDHFGFDDHRAMNNASQSFSFGLPATNGRQYQRSRRQESELPKTTRAVTAPIRRRKQQDRCRAGLTRTTPLLQRWRPELEKRCIAATPRRESVYPQAARPRPPGSDGVAFKTTDSFSAVPTH
jgi:hypothetical protein